MDYASNVLPGEVKESLRKIIKYLYDIHTAQKDLNTSPFCWFLCEVAVNIGRYFSIIILEVILFNEQQNVLLYKLEF